MEGVPAQTETGVGKGTHGENQEGFQRAWESQGVEISFVQLIGDTGSRMGLSVTESLLGSYPADSTQTKDGASFYTLKMQMSGNSRVESGWEDTHLRGTAGVRLLLGRDMAMRLRVRVRGGMGGIPGAEERGWVGGAAGRAGPGHVILSLGPVPGMASPLAGPPGLNEEDPLGREGSKCQLRIAGSEFQDGWTSARPCGTGVVGRPGLAHRAPQCLGPPGHSTLGPLTLDLLAL